MSINPIKASVIILTKNPGAVFQKVLPAVLGQETPWAFDIWVIDSGSTDGTLEFCAQFPAVHVYQIKPEEFQHGRTRNLAISLSAGEFAVMLTHDAIPASNQWLVKLVSATEASPEIAGSFGRHLPHDDADILVQDSLKRHFDGFMEQPSVVKMEDHERYQNDQGYRQFLHFFSDNNACIRRSIWNVIPYPEVDFAEDQLWAKSIIEAGFAKAYVDDAPVYHSHNMGVWETFQRSFDESKAFFHYFGYNLCPDLLSLLKAPVKLSGRDWIFLANQEKPWTYWALFLLSPLLNIARVFGHCFGRYSHRLPDIIQYMCSRDRRIKGRQSMQITGLSNLIRKVFITWKKCGTQATLKIIIQRLRQSTPVTVFGHDLLKHYRFILDLPYGGCYDSTVVPSKTITWFIPDFNIGSGGHLNIFRFVYHLERLGYTNHITIVESSHFSSPEAARQCIIKHFFPINADVSIGRAFARPAQYGFATSWQTAYALRSFQNVAHKCYFVQDFEPGFYPFGSEYALAEATYRFGFYGVTAGTWLSTMLQDNYKMQCSAVGFSFDKELYQFQANQRLGRKRVFFYARQVTPRRGFELGILALHQLYKRLPDCEIHFAGWDIHSYHIPFPHVSHGVVALSDLSALYNQCDAALVLSFSNLSLLPLELMASGCPVVSNKGANTEWLLNDTIASMAEPTPEAIAEALYILLTDDDKAQRQRQNALEFCEKTSWQLEAQKMVLALEGLGA